MNKKILIYTTFGEKGYNQYGKKWIETLTENVLNHNENIHAKIYYNGFEKPDDTHKNIEWVDFDKNIPHHKDWIENFKKTSNHGFDYARYTNGPIKGEIIYVKKGPRKGQPKWHFNITEVSIKWSFKSFVIQHVLDHCNEFDYTIWTDGDVIFHKHSYENFPENILENKFLSLQVEIDNIRKGTDGFHIESGILIFNQKHSDIKIFNDYFKKCYTDDIIHQVKFPFDGYLIYKALNDTKLSYNDLNKDRPLELRYITDNPNRTFLHSEIKPRFSHLIGDNKDKIK